MKAAYLKYLKMGDGPLYTFYTPLGLPHLEIPLTVSRAVLFGDATVAPIGAPACDSLAIAKRDLKAGEILDGPGGFMSYALIENYRQGLRGTCPWGFQRDVLSHETFQKIKSSPTRTSYSQKAGCVTGFEMSRRLGFEIPLRPKPRSSPAL